MITNLKITSLLLSYPSEGLRQAIPDLKEVLVAKSSTSARERKLLAALAEDIARCDLYDAQERYVFLFDRTRSLSLHLFEHVHGESRDRGQAMVDLMAMYEENGLVVDEKELPDYLPLFLEYLSIRPIAEAQEMIGQILHIITALKELLKKRNSIYANAFMALEVFAKAKPDAKLVDAILAIPEDDPDDLAALDRIWEEEVVAFGGGAGENDCGPDRLHRQMRAHSRKPADMPRSSPTLEN